MPVLYVTLQAASPAAVADKELLKSPSNIMDSTHPDKVTSTCLE